MRRLGAEDSSIDIIGMDVIWTAEFANAGWVEEWTGKRKQDVTEKVFPGVIETASFEGKLYAAPFNTNTQLLWYRKDLVKKPPRTWDEMIDKAEKMGRDNAGTIQVQASRYEGFTVWANALIESAGTPILSGPETLDLEAGPDRKGAGGDGQARQLLGGAAGHLDLRRGQRPARLRGGRIGLHDQLHLRLRQRQGRSARHRQGDGLRPLPPASTPKRPSKPPLGGFNLAVSSYSNNKDLAFDAAACLAGGKSQLTAAELDGLPPSRSDLYTNKVVTKAYPGFAGLVKESIEGAGPRPTTPAYQDVSSAIQRTLHPPEKIDPEDTESIYDELKSNLEARSSGKGCSDGGEHGPAPPHQREDALRAPARLDALRARGAGDARRHRLPDRLRDRPLGAADRPALPRRGRLRRPRQLQPRC